LPEGVCCRALKELECAGLARCIRKILHTDGTLVEYYSFQQNVSGGFAFPANALFRLQAIA
jgi:hypothetical protein